VQYTSDNEHWAGSSSQLSACSVEPSTSEDVAAIFGIIQKTRTVWAVKNGGHAFNPGFSSTDGVLISMTRFKEINHIPATSTVKIGAGNLWDDVYVMLVPLGVTVVGGCVPGVGVAGFTLGGGYSWKTQNCGLALDNVVFFELVTSTAQILNVTAQSHPDLFFGLKGGGNNFSIVTTFAGTIVYSDDIPAVRQAIEDFNANVDDPNALILLSYVYEGSALSITLYLFYDEPTPYNEIFSVFLEVEAIENDVKTRSSWIFNKALVKLPLLRGSIATQTVPIIRFTKRIVDAIVNQTIFLGLSDLINRTDGLINLAIEPFQSSLYDHSTGGAFPHSAAHPGTPFLVYLGYTDPEADAVALATARTAASVIQQITIEEGQSSKDAILYNNYAQKGTDLRLIFGGNLPLLRTVRAKYDPHDLLSLTSGWRF
ncbi:hypothetical protein M422DRAFT_152673, partial [Sphaerobolus stellatus SS14]